MILQKNVLQSFFTFVTTKSYIKVTITLNIRHPHSKLIIRSQQDVLLVIWLHPKLQRPVSGTLEPDIRFLHIVKICCQNCLASLAHCFTCLGHLGQHDPGSFLFVSYPKVAKARRAKPAYSWARHIALCNHGYFCRKLCQCKDNMKDNSLTKLL